MRNFLKPAALAAYIMLGLAPVALAQTKKAPAAPAPAAAGPINFAPLTLKSADLELQVDQFGSAISSIKLKGFDVNPLDWSVTRAQMPKNNQSGAPFRGHFLCIGRWGGPSDQEIARGLPHNGEVNTRRWTLVQAPKTEGGASSFVSRCAMPLDQYSMTRKVVLPQQAAAGSTKGGLFYVEEEVTNVGNNPRVFNWVQHATLGGAFLTDQTLVDCNAGRGFDQRSECNRLEAESFNWPNGMLTDGPADLRRCDDKRGYVTTHLMDTTTGYGWITAISPQHGLVYGYIWKTKEYPWVNVWHHYRDGKPWARGLEFGTTGLGEPYSQLVGEQVSFFGHRMFDWFEPGQVLRKSYIGFIAAIPQDFNGVQSVTLNNGQLVITERQGHQRSISLNAGQLLK